MIVIPRVQGVSGSNSNFLRQVDTEDASAGLVVSSDDFSVKVASNVDPRFWVRVEKEMDHGALIVTDFAPGVRPIEELEAGLTVAVRALSADRPVSLAFRDLVPGGEQIGGFPAKLVRAVDLVKRLGAAVAADLSTSVANVEMRPRRGKIDAVVTFERLRAV